ncbi:hypothetical protein C8R43DRAFT_948277 [Mycena crocata]|nr:hypothetical protein C8R43DRAFT_948277 [Mycena crocata]
MTEAQPAPPYLVPTPVSPKYKPGILNQSDNQKLIHETIYRLCSQTHESRRAFVNISHLLNIIDGHKFTSATMEDIVAVISVWDDISNPRWHVVSIKAICEDYMADILSFLTMDDLNLLMTEVKEEIAGFEKRTEKAASVAKDYADTLDKFAREVRKTQRYVSKELECLKATLQNARVQEGTCRVLFPSLVSLISAEQYINRGSSGTYGMRGTIGTVRPARAAANSRKAKQAAAIASAEAKEAEAAGKHVPRKRGRPPKNSQPVEDPPPEEDDLDDGDGEDTEEMAIESIEWSQDLVWRLVTAIEDNEEIREGLFPGVGAIRLSGAKPKTHHYYNLAVKIFADHPTYKDIFAINPEDSPAKKQERRRSWTDKIKNKIKKLVKKARDNIDELGQTGAGIGSEEEILPGTGFTTKWEVIKADSPWFFNMRSLIAARPNLQPVGLGNAGSRYDLSLLMRNQDGDETSSVPDDGQDLLDEDSDSDDDLLTAPTLAESRSAKRKRVEDDVKSTATQTARPAAKKTKPQAAASVPATPAPPIPKKAITSKDRFSATIVAEEETNQRQLELKKGKVNARQDLGIAKIQTEGKVRIALASEGRRKEKAAKMELMRLKMEQEHQFRMAQMQMQAGPSSMSFAGSGSSNNHSSTFSSFLDDPELPRLPSHDPHSADTNTYGGFGQYSNLY